MKIFLACVFFFSSFLSNEKGRQLSNHILVNRLKISRQIYPVHRGPERRTSSWAGDSHVGASPTSSEVAVHLFS
jgi:hypothetical protein